MQSIANQNRSAPLIIRADANARIGTGHVMRCIALGQAWQDKNQRSEVGGRRSDESGKVVFITCCDNDLLLQRLRDENFEVIELASPNEFVSCLSSDLRPLTSDSWFVLDGYHFTTQDHQAIRNAGHRLLVIDDCSHLPEYECDILLNQNVTAESLTYCINPDAQLLLGPQFALLRREFFQALEEFKPVFPDSGKTEAIGTRILVTLGGADPDNVSLKVINALRQLNDPDLDVRVVVGPANPHGAALEATVQRSTFNVELINSANMAECMRWADFAVSAAGSTCWELLCLNVPFATVILAENQEAVARYLEEKGGIHCFGWVTPEFENQVVEFLKKIQVARLAQPASIVDGQGASRVVEQIMGRIG